MNWRLDGAYSLVLRRDPNDLATVVKICLVAGLQERFCIGLCLLKERLIDKLDLVSTDGGHVIRVQRAVQVTSVQLGRAKTVLTLHEVELERWQYFTLRAVRDGAAEVDHFDVDAILEGGTNVATVTVAFPSSVPPVSPEEARRRLGL